MIYHIKITFFCWSPIFEIVKRSTKARYCKYNETILLLSKLQSKGYGIANPVRVESPTYDSVFAHV